MHQIDQPLVLPLSVSPQRLRKVEGGREVLLEVRDHLGGKIIRGLSAGDVRSVGVGDVPGESTAKTRFRHGAEADRFPAAQSYAAGEQMAEYIESGFWDLVVVDTPPAAGGIEFFQSPAMMRELVGGRLLRWLTARLGERSRRERAAGA